MKKLFAILAALTVAAPANAFIAVPEEHKEPTTRSSSIHHRFCYLTDSAGEVVSETYNRKCRFNAVGANVEWRNVETCDDFEGCVKVDIQVNTKAGTAYYDDRTIGVTPVFVSRNSPVSYYETVTVECQAPARDLIVETIEWKESFDNPVRYQYNLKQLQRDVCNTAFEVDTSAQLIDAAMTFACNRAHPEDGDKRNKCVDDFKYNRERRQWK